MYWGLEQDQVSVKAGDKRPCLGCGRPYVVEQWQLDAWGDDQLVHGSCIERLVAKQKEIADGLADAMSFG